MEFKYKTKPKELPPNIDDALLDSDSDSDQEDIAEKPPKEDPVDWIEDESTATLSTDFRKACEDQCETNYLNPTLKFDQSFEGDLDLDFLTKGTKKGSVREIYFHSPGKIISLKNLPETVEVLYCPNQEIREIEPLPRNLKTLHVPKNRLESLDLAKVPELKNLNVSENELHTISNLPASLEEIRATQNPKLTLLDLDEPYMISKSLKVLETDPHVVLKNFDYEEFIKHNHKDQNCDGEHKAGKGKKKEKTPEGSPPFVPSSPPKISFQDAINKYFEYKNQYEKEERKFRRQIKQRAMLMGTNKSTKKGRSRQELPSCIKCKQAVGMTFKRDGRFYIAKCGIGTKYNCDFHLEIKSPDVVDFIQEIEEAHQNFQENKDSIIRMKMDHLFGYSSDVNTNTLFEKEMKSYKTNNEYVGIILSEYQNLFGKNLEKEFEIEQIDKEFQDSMKHYQELVDEYRRDPLNHALMDDAMEFYLTKLRPIRMEWMYKVYPIIEMNRMPFKKEYQFVGKNEEIDPSKLYYSHITPNFYSYEFEPGAAFVFNENA